MPFYRLCLLDQPKSSWVLHDVIKRTPKRKNPEMPSAFYKFFPPPDADVHIKQRYQSLCCPKCGKYDSDEVFDEGFEEPMAIRFKQDFAWTDDRQLVMNDKVRDAIRAAKIGGIELKPIGKSGWHVAKITTRVKCAKDAYSLDKQKCSKCGHHADGGGAIWAERQLAVPKTLNTFFTTTIGGPAHCFADRSVFFTEDVYAALKAAKVKGPYCERLQTDAEIEKRAAMEKKGVRWLPPGMTKYLGG